MHEPFLFNSHEDVKRAAVITFAEFVSRYLRNSGILPSAVFGNFGIAFGEFRLLGDALYSLESL